MDPIKALRNTAEELQSGGLLTAQRLAAAANFDFRLLTQLSTWLGAIVSDGSHNYSEYSQWEVDDANRLLPFVRGAIGVALDRA